MASRVVRTNLVHSAKPMRAFVAKHLKFVSISGDEAPNLINSPMICLALRGVCLWLSEGGVIIHFGMPGCSPCSGWRVALTASALKLALAFALRRRDRSSRWRKTPVSPLALVAAMHERTHRQCAGEAALGVFFRRAVKQLIHNCALCSGM
eukprot:2094544-Prymnesium_polylepis.2